MTSPEKQKGSAAERAVVDWFRAHGFDCDRTRAGWTDDRGDVHGILDLTVEVKNQKRLDLAGWLDELEVEIENAETPFGVLIAKRRGKRDPGDWYAVMPAAQWMKLWRVICGKTT